MKFTLPNAVISRAIQAGVVLAGTGEYARTPEAVVVPGVEEGTTVSLPAQPAVNLTALQENLLSHPLSITVPATAEWDAKAQKRFKALATKEALEEITDEERTELNQLSALRRRAESRLTADELLLQYRQRRLTADLLRILGQYADLSHAPARPSKA